LSREAKIEEEFYRLTKNVLERRKYVIEGVKFGSPEPQYPVDSGITDLMIPTHALKPLFIAEFKRKISTAKGLKVVRDIDPLGSKVIIQALTYAVQCGASLFATTNGKIFALFTTPERGDAFRIDRHRLLVKEIQLTEEAVEEALQIVARWHQGVKVERTTLDWTFIMRLRSFVEWLSRQMLPLVRERLEVDAKFKKRYEALSEEVGGITPSVYSREAAYILMNKIVFYKILERYYSNLLILEPIPPKNGADFSSKLGICFDKAIEVTKDFEPIFKAEFYDEAPLPDDVDALEEINAFIDDMEAYKLEEVGSDVVGFIYERLIPEEERHQLGQFYTPPQIAELIVKWAVRDATNLVMDPACGSGTFLVKAYGRLRDLRVLTPESVHKEILGQLYAVDINSFPAHITAMNLAMRDVRHPTSEMNVVVDDFFTVIPMQKVLVPYTIRTPKGEIRREILIPLMDVVVANPPYTRWTEIPNKTQEAIKKRIAGTLKKYGLTARVQQGIEPGIYLHFIIWAHEFLKSSGRLGMIISDSWLQADYGTDFGRFLLSHFKIKAVIDISARVFPIPLIGTCIILLEKEEDTNARDDNQIAFVYLDVPRGSSFDVDNVLEVVENPDKYSEEYHVRVVSQNSIKEKKWIDCLFNINQCLSLFQKSPKLTELGSLFEVAYGNITYLVLATKGVVHGVRNVGGESFFYLTDNDASAWGLVRKWVHPLLPSSRYAKNFTFTKEDWDALKKRNSECWLFSAHKYALPDNVKDYIKHGETNVYLRISKKVGAKAKTVNLSEASKTRAGNKKHFCGWYDLGGVKKAPMFAARGTQYRSRFILMEEMVALDDRLIAFIPKIELNNDMLKAMLAYLNSSFTHLQIESLCRITGGGMIELDVRPASEILVLDPKKLSKSQIKRLASLFDELEAEARKLGGADTKENSDRLADKVVNRIDLEIAKILNLTEKTTKEVRLLAKTMMERRLARAEEARPEAIRGEEAPRIKPPKDSQNNSKEDRLTQPLERFLR